MCFVAPEQKLFYGNFLSADSVESVYNLGLNFAKFLLPPGLVYNLFCRFKQKMFYGQLFVTWLRRDRIGTRSLISLKFSRPGLVYYMFRGSRAEVVLRQFLLPDSVEHVLEAGA